jgi:YD repeat-containing protein
MYYVNDAGMKRPAFMLDYDSEGRLTQYIKMSREFDLIYDFRYNKDGLVSEYIVSRATPTYYIMNEYSDTVEEQHLYLHYTDSGDLEEITSEGGAFVYRFEYDEQGRVISKEAGTEVYTFFYDGNRATPSEGRLTDHESNTKTYIYDENGCLTKVQNADGSYTRYEYQELSLTKEEAEKFYRQQQMQLRSPVYLDWVYLSYENPWDYLIPTPINPALFTGPATVSGNGNEM